MLDVGQIDAANFNSVLSKIRNVLESEYGAKIMGISIDSGDVYGQGSSQVLYAEKMVKEIDVLIEKCS